MKFLAFICIWVSLVFGLLSSTRAYTPSLDRNDLFIAGEDLLTLNGPAGVVRLGDPSLLAALGDDSTQVLDDLRTNGDFEALMSLERLADVDAATIELDEATGLVRVNGNVVPLMVKDQELNANALAALRANAEALADTPQATHVVRLKEFSLGRWEYSWVAGLSALGLLAGGVLTRMGRGSAVATSASDIAPDAALRSAEEEVKRILHDVVAMSNESEQLHTIVQRLDAVQTQYFVPFVDAREQLVGQLGMSGYAQLMDVFAGAERILNRAWSAAADHEIEEAIECLQHGVLRLDESVGELDAGASRRAGEA